MIIPFGKYKGQPAEVMAQDQAYCDWLVQQPWFKEKYQSVYNTIIIVNQGEAADTPEHNRWQALFTDEAFCRWFCAGIHGEDLINFNAVFEFLGFDVLLRADNAVAEYDGWRTPVNFLVEVKPTVGDDFPSVLRQIKANMERVNRRCADPKDMYYSYLLPNNYNNNYTVLFIGEYQGSVAKEQFIKMFETSGICVAIAESSND